jgi:hypothetical protein
VRARRGGTAGTGADPDGQPPRRARPHHLRRPAGRAGAALPAGARAARGHPGPHARAPAALGRSVERTAGGADGAPGRRAGRGPGPLDPPALLRRGRRRQHLGPRHARRQGLRGGDLHRGRGAPRGRPRAGAGRVALLRVRRGGLRTGRPGGGPDPDRARGRAVVRPRRGRRGGGRGLPRGAPSRGGRGRDREGGHLAAAAGRGTRRPRLHARPQRADRPDRAGDHRAGAQPDAGERAAPPRSSSSVGSPRTPGSRWARCSLARRGCPPCWCARCWPPARRPRR